MSADAGRIVTTRHHRDGRESYTLVWRNFYVSCRYLIELMFLALDASLLTVCVLSMPLFLLVSCFMLYTSLSDWLL